MSHFSNVSSSFAVLPRCTSTIVLERKYFCILTLPLIDFSRRLVSHFYRSPKPLFTLRAHGTKGTPLKGLSVGWSGSTVASGGADCQLKTFGLDGLGL
jgi:hypothetical protein